MKTKLFILTGIVLFFLSCDDDIIGKSDHIKRELSFDKEEYLVKIGEQVPMKLISSWSTFGSERIGFSEIGANGERLKLTNVKVLKPYDEKGSYMIEGVNEGEFIISFFIIDALPKPTKVKVVK